MKIFSSVGCFIGYCAIAIGLEIVRRTFGVPISFIDMVFSPLAIIMTLVLIKEFVHKRKKKEAAPSQNISVLKSIAFLSFFLFIILPMTVFVIWMGVNEPTAFFSGCKGSAHGYSLIIIGVFILVTSLILIHSLSRTIYMTYTTRAKMAAWIKDITNEGPLPSHCKAILIGLIEGEEDYLLYFSGSVDFDPEDDGWACQDERDYEPEHKYHHSGVPISEDWESLQVSVVAHIQAIRRKGGTILNHTHAIAVGFDTGDLVYIEAT